MTEFVAMPHEKLGRSPVQQNCAPRLAPSIVRAPNGPETVPVTGVSVTSRLGVFSAVMETVWVDGV
jgi:hypothetical protein